MDKKHPYSQSEDADLDTELEDGLVKELGEDEEKSKNPGVKETGFDELEELDESEEPDAEEL
ncbi:MAG: hypothetical protein HYW79_00935 [Parcubacteria group bacterium]|nr:hypothetical protein [Parcubacteria group bacterium]